MNPMPGIAMVAVGAFLALLGAAFAYDDLFAAHMWVLLIGFVFPISLTLNSI